jgi:1-pyrroline-5-carboxylate dehydrogenase
LSEFENEYTWGKAISSNSTDNFHADFEKAIDEVKKKLGKKHPIIINGKEIYSDNCFTASSPSDTRISVAEFPKATVDDTKNAISSAKNAFEKWSNTPFLAK